MPKKVNLTLDRLFYRTLLVNPDEKIVYKDRYITYNNLFKNSCKIANALNELGFKNKNIAVMDWNTIEFAELLYGIPFSGNLIHSVNIRLPPDELIKTIVSANDSVIFFSKDMLPIIEKIKSLGIIPKENLIIMGEESAEYKNMNDMIKNSSDKLNLNINENDLVMILFTSGTTGIPKGVKYSSKDIILAVWSILTLLSSYEGNSRLNSKDVIFSLIPFYHIFSWGTLYISTLLGSKYVMDGKFDVESTLNAIEKNKVTWMSMVPTMLYALLSSKDAHKMNGMKILIGGSAIPSGLVKNAIDHNIELTSIYGFTDGLIGGIGTLKGKGSRKKEEEYYISTAYFTPAPFTEYYFDESKGGEIYFRAPWLPDEYFNIPKEESLKSFTEDGWFRPGDAGSIESEGKIKIKDRIKDLIKSGGEFIPTMILENLISELEPVELVAVVGKEDLKWIERPWAVIKTKKGKNFNEKEARKHLEKYAREGIIEKWWIPDRFILIDDMPLTGTGKIDKKILKDKIRDIN
ncbi:MAG TPA: AMP-dependent synthetase [Thermodesulfobium narugense]|nr:AMP-dependent synthetase [Thermodesulfobium narugense]